MLAFSLSTGAIIAALMPLAAGTRLSQYEILSPLGAGSMGEVYRARDSRLDRDVAIKVLPELVSSEPERLQRFETEAKAAAALNHPNILAVYQMGTYAGVPYLVSELLEGMTLTESIRRGPLPLRKALDYAVQIAHGLAAAHEKGIVHRDLKPDNLFVTKDGRIKILDFGLAKVVPPKESLTSAAPTLTMPGVAMGTMGYMSPEQVRGLATDHRTDIFAFGAILYEMVMGKRSFERPTSADTISAILNEEPPPISELAPETPVALQKVVLRCLEKNAEQRFQSASDLAFALEALSDPAIAAPTGAHAIKKDGAKKDGPNADAPRHSPRALTAAVLAVMLIVLALAYFWMRPAPAPTVANYVQLTHDGQPKSLIGTDGSRLYLGVGLGTSGSFAFHGIAEMSVSGGDPRRMSIMPSPDMVPVDLSPDGSELLVVDGRGAPPRGTDLESADSWRIPAPARGYRGRNRRLVSRWQDAGIQQPERSVRGQGGRNRSAEAAYREGRHQECHVVAGQRAPAIRQLGERRNHRPATRMGSVGDRDRLAPLGHWLARSARRMLRQVDCRRESISFFNRRVRSGRFPGKAAFFSPSPSPLR